MSELCQGAVGGGERVRKLVKILVNFFFLVCVFLFFGVLIIYWGDSFVYDLELFVI